MSSGIRILTPLFQLRKHLLSNSRKDTEEDIPVSAARFRAPIWPELMPMVVCGFPGSRPCALESLDIRSSSSSPHDYISFLGSPCLELARKKYSQTRIVWDTVQSRDASQHSLTTKARKTFRGFLQLYITSHYKPRPEAGGSRWIFAFAFASKGIVGGRCEYAIIILRNQHPVANKCTMTDRECR